MKAYTDIKQSKTLAEILPIESADLWWNESKNYPEFIKTYHEYLSVSIPPIPCWSLAALIEALPKIYLLKPILDLEENSILYSGTDLDVRADNIIDACVEMLIKLHELKML